ncbi:unnamed protein product, partial [Prorocentrum cordatum]
GFRAVLPLRRVVRLRGRPRAQGALPAPRRVRGGAVVGHADGRRERGGVVEVGLPPVAGAGEARGLRLGPGGGLAAAPRRRLG